MSINVSMSLRVNCIACLSVSSKFLNFMYVSNIFSGTVDCLNNYLICGLSRVKKISAIIVHNYIFTVDLKTMENCNHTPNQPGKVPYDPGWNDPPKFSYNTQQTTPNRPRNFLNKRVAFPLSGAGAAPAAVPPVNIPPIPSALQIAPPVNIPPKIETQENVDVDSESALHEVKGILLLLLDNSSELGLKANDIRRRISVMEDMWVNDKLNKRIHFQMRELAYALQNEEPQKADEIHRALMVDHVSAVGTWMPGVKQLIHNCIARTELLALDED